MFRLIAAAGGAVPSITPKATLPGTGLLQSVASGVMEFALALCVIGILVSAAMMGVGHLSSNQRAQDRGKSGLIGSLAGAVVAGGAVALINFAFASGGKIH